MQTKIHIAILALVLATTMMTSAAIPTLMINARAQEDGSNPLAGLTEFFENVTGGGTEPISENGTVPEESTNVTEGGAVTTPGPEVCPPVVPPVVVFPPEDNATAGNESEEVPPVVETPVNETEVVPPVVTEPPVEETADNETMVVEEPVVEEPPIVVVPDGNVTTGENGTVVLPPDVPIIVPGENSTEEVIDAIENQTEQVENATENVENATETPETPSEVTEVIEIELTKEIGAGFLTLLQVGQFIPSVTAEEVASLQTAAVALGDALSSAIEASGSSISIDQSNVGSGDQSNTATVNQGSFEDSTAQFYDAAARRGR